MEEEKKAFGHKKCLKIVFKMHFWCDFNKLFETFGETAACFISLFTSEANRREVIEWAVWLTPFGGLYSFPPILHGLYTEDGCSHGDVN